MRSWRVRWVKLYNDTRLAGRMNMIGLMGIREDFTGRPVWGRPMLPLRVTLGAPRCFRCCAARVTKVLRDPVGIAVKVALST